MAHNLCRGLANGSQQSYPDSLHSFAQRLQEIRRQLEQLTSKGEEKLKIDDVGRWAAASVLQCFSASVLRDMLDTCVAGACSKHIIFDQCHSTCSTLRTMQL